MAVAPKKVVTKAVTKTTKPKAPPKPTFGELGFEFNIKAKIVGVFPENDDYNHPYAIEVDIGDFDNLEYSSKGIINFDYPSMNSLSEVVSKTVPALTKKLKQDELNKAKAEVARLTKELAAIK
jgi:hypothetical protein